MRLPSILLNYVDERLQTRRIPGIYRSFSWDRAEENLILAGNGGRILKVHGERVAVVASGTNQNLRKISVNPSGNNILIAGNAGCLLRLNEDATVSKVEVPTTANLRAADWNHEGTLALIAGNGGTLLEYTRQKIQAIDGGRANFRHIAWRPKTNFAILTSNCFAEEFTPSPNLFSYDAETQTLRSSNEGRADLIGADWKRDGTSALVVGYDVIWHNGLLAMFDGGGMSPVCNLKQIYPVAASWNPFREIAAIATATAQSGLGEGSVLLWDCKTFKPIFSNNEFFFSAIGWNRKGTELVALGSTATRTFNC